MTSTQVLNELRSLSLTGQLHCGRGCSSWRRGSCGIFYFETNPLDPVVFVAVSALLVGVCLLASWLPARRASTRRRCCASSDTLIRLH
ncbi:MAG: hypothetical protein E2P06_10310 [Acidobacteria bacterium]|nr:MAG: hypothetical protein E2P06_10310 [Acidobacteriota bacterium]